MNANPAKSLMPPSRGTSKVPQGEAGGNDAICLDPESLDDGRPDERHLLPRHRQGDTAAFAELMQLYRSPVYSYLVRSGIPNEQREDLFQDIFLRIHRSATRYQPNRPLHPWIFTIAANTVRNYWRGQRVRDLTSGAPPMDAVDDAPLGSTIAESRQTVSFLEQRIAELPQPQREVLLLVSVEGLSLKETAAALTTPLNTIKTRLHRARLALARALGNRDAAEGRA